MWTVRRTARGCYRVGPFVFPFVWIAANELPLRDDLVPFLVARSGRALNDFGRWVATRRPADWVLDMVQYTAMSTKARAQVINSVETDDPEVAARQRHLVQLLLAKHPEFGQDLQEKGRKEGRREGRRKGRIEEAARNLLTVLRARGIAVPDTARERILAEKDPARLERWVERAAVAVSLAEVLDDPS